MAQSLAKLYTRVSMQQCTFYVETDKDLHVFLLVYLTASFNFHYRRKRAFALNFCHSLISLFLFTAIFYRLLKCRMNHLKTLMKLLMNMVYHWINSNQMTESLLLLIMRKVIKILCIWHYFIM